MDQREMYQEINALIGSIAKALNLPEADVVAALEKGEITLDFGEDENNHRFVAVTHDGRQSRIYQGAIRHAPEEPGQEEAPKSGGGCGCGGGH
ncbi:hypothetical protein [Telmatospirillum sp. J64-1]|uniref:hypothetical protein n=1 Tax=Telmatospirillum sp. J64-1 TaxID=2502183 RepID=UPI00115D6502|nr:hypothetical protein [Telmatospirillum sp. J64-1]